MPMDNINLELAIFTASILTLQSLVKQFKPEAFDVCS